MAKILVINGPNLARLGSREPEIYGTMNYDQLTERIHDASAQLGHTVEVRQSDSESELIGWLHEAVDNKSDVVINPAAFTHYSYALRDAAAMVTKDGLRLIEVHISNPHSREEFRHKSVISAVASGVIAGFGVESYILALKALA